MDFHDETTPLLVGEESRRQQQPLPASQTALARVWAKYESLPTVVRVTPIIFLSSLSDGLPQLTIVEIMKRVSCAVWYLKNDPDELPGNGAIPDEKCQNPGPVAWFSAFMIIQALLMAFGGFIMASLISQYGTRVGRKPVLLLILLGQVMAMASFVAAIFVPSDIGAFILLGVWLVGGSFCSAFPLLFTCNLMVVDSTDPGDRTAALSFTMGATAAGGIPSFALGGVIYRVAGPRTLCLITLGIFGFTLLLASTGLVRETFGGNKLEAARFDRRERRRTARERSLERGVLAEGDSTWGVRRRVRKTVEAIHTVFEPVLRLKPTIKEDGKINFRLPSLGIAYLFAALGTGYFGPAIISHMILILHNDPQQSGVIMTTISIFQTVGLAIIFPFVASNGRELYTKFHSGKEHKKQEGSGLSNGGTTERQPTMISGDNGDTLDNPASEISLAHFDVYLLRCCYFSFVLLLLGVGYVNTTVHIMALSSILLVCSGAHPAVQSVAAASVSPIQAGEAIAGIEMVGHIARFVSPIVIGAIQSKTVLTMPTTVFNIMAAFMLMAAVLTFLIRDEDRYIPPLVAGPIQGDGTDSEQ